MSSSRTRSQSSTVVRVSQSFTEGQVSQSEEPQPVINVMTFESAREILNSAYAPQVPSDQTRTRGRKAARKRKVNWKPVVEAYQRESGLRGLPLQDIENILKVIIDKSVSMNIMDKAAFVLCMAPQKKLPRKLVEEMIDWSVRIAIESETLNKVELNLLTYFIGLLEYDLIEESPFDDYYYYNVLLAILRRHDSTINLICHILKLATKPYHVKDSLVSFFQDFRVRNLTVTQVRAVEDLLRLYKGFSPKLFSKNSLKLKVIGPNRFTEVDHTFKLRMYEAQGRVLGRPVTDIPLPPMSKSKKKRSSTALDCSNSYRIESNLVELIQNSNDMFFPEFAPNTRIVSFGNTKISDLKKEEKMHHFLRNDNCVLMILVDTPILHRFYTWVSLIFQHKFETYDSKQAHRYRFILQRCCLFTRIQGYALPPVDEWLPEFLTSWDGILFRREILQLFKYMSLLDFEAGYLCILDKFEKFFIHGNLNERLEIWKVLEQLYIHWSNLIKYEEKVNVIGSNIRTPEDMVKTLFYFMCHLISQYAALNGVGEYVLLFMFCDSFGTFLSNFLESGSPSFIPAPPMVLWLLVLASESLKLVDSFCTVILKIHGYRAEKNTPGLKKASKLCREIGNFFTKDAPLRNLFRAENETIENIEKNEDGNNNSNDSGNEDFGRNLKLEFEFLLKGFACYNCSFLRDYGEPTNGNSKNVMEYDMIKLERDAPHIFNLLSNIL